MKTIMNNLKNYKVRPIPAILTIVIVLGIPYFVYFHIYTMVNLRETKNEIETLTANTNQKIADIETILLATHEKNLTLAEALESAKERTESLSEQFEDVSDNVEDLEKITMTDKELLQKYSKVYFLNEHYSPPDLKTIPSKYTYNEERKYEVHNDVWDYLEELLEEAEEDGIDLQVISAFRSFGEQAILKGAYTVSYGAGTANQFSADQGYSEHQLGTTIDFTTTSVGATFSGFAKTEEFEWLQKNAHRFGFSLSYPQNNEHYQFEPWHWRFIGERLADDLHDDGEYFYELTQRKIDEYIIYLFD